MKYSINTTQYWGHDLVRELFPRDQWPQQREYAQFFSVSNATFICISTVKPIRPFKSQTETKELDTFYC